MLVPSTTPPNMDSDLSATKETQSEWGIYKEVDQISNLEPPGSLEPLFLAVRKKKSTLVVKRLLKENRCDLNSKDKRGRILLFEAIERGKLPVVELLLERSEIDPNIRDDEGRTPLSQAVVIGQTSRVEVLLNHTGIDRDPRDNDGRTPLSHAAGRANKEITQLLLNHDGVKPDSRDNDGCTPLSRAAEFSDDPSFGWITSDDQREVVKLLLEQGSVDPNSKDNSNRTPLLKAAQRGYDGAVELFLDNPNVDPNHQDNDGWTSLAHAAEHGYVKVVKLLLGRSDINPDPKDKLGRTPLSRASQRGQKEVIKLLLEYGGVDPDSRGKKGRTPFSHMAGSTSIKMSAQSAGFELLHLQGGVNLNSKDNTGRTPLSWAAGRGCEAAVRWLRAQEGVALDEPDNKKRTPLRWAAEKGHAEIVELLLALDGVDPDTIDEDSNTPLCRALENGHDKVVKLFVTKDKATLHTQVQKDNLHLVRLLLQAKYNLNTRDSLGRTPLHIAIIYGHSDIAKELLYSKANIHAKDVNGKTPLHLALQHKHEDLIQLLLDHSAHTKGIKSDQWFDVYKKRSLGAVLEMLYEPGGKISVRIINDPRIQMQLEPVQTRRLLLFSDHLTWSTRAAFDKMRAMQLERSHISYHMHTHENGASIFLSGGFPIGQENKASTQFSVSNWGKCEIAWSIVPPAKSKDDSTWRSIDHFSTLPYGYIPDSGAHFFSLFIKTLKQEWLALCALAEEHLAKRRVDQLKAKGQSITLIHCLAEDAQEWARLRSDLRSQVRAAGNFASEYCRYYDQHGGSKVVSTAINEFETEVGEQISRLEQTVKDLLQFEFAWVSINEAHKSTSIATSIKRLSWITFIFLPAMFASSLFGMNVNVLESNPDWRWFLLFVAGFFVITVLGWLLFKYGQVERLVERQVGSRLLRWSRTGATDV